MGKPLRRSFFTIVYFLALILAAPLQSRAQSGRDVPVLKPQNLNIKVLDYDAPDVVINEILADPAGDANGDGAINSGDEFVEIVNNSGRSLDFSSWTLSDGTGVKYTFKEGIVISAGKAMVVFGEPAIGSSYGAASLFAAGSLSLKDEGDTVILKNAAGNLVTSVRYDGSVDNQSITRNPDITGAFVAHSTVAGSVGNYSPGTKANGTAFGANYAIAFRGNEGWRTISSPTQNTTFLDLLSDMRVQGVTGSDAPSAQKTLFTWDEASTSFTPITEMSDELAPGRGYIVYAFADDKFSMPGLQGGFPKIISTDKTENSPNLNIPVSSTDTDGNRSLSGNEGWNMLGNPYGIEISVDAVLAALAKVNSSLNANVYIWDYRANSGNGNYEILSEGNGGSIAPFQAFWVRYTTTGVNGSAAFNRSQLAVYKGTAYYDRVSMQTQNFILLLGNGMKYDDYKVKFSSKGNLGEDEFDAYKLFSLNPHSVNLFSELGEGIKLAVNVLPSISTLEHNIHIPLYYELPSSGEYTFNWSNIDQLPQPLNIYLVDRETGAKVDLRSRKKYTFNYRMAEKQKSLSLKREPRLNRMDDTKSDSRFEIVLAFNKVNETKNQIEKAVSLAPNYPNPFRSQTTIEFKLKNESPVTLTVWNIVGQKVATIYDHKSLSGGKHRKSWSVSSDLPSGIYILKLEASGKVLIRKMTLIK